MENLNQIIKQFPEVGEVKEVKALTNSGRSVTRIPNP